MTKRHPVSRRRKQVQGEDPDDLFIAKTLEFSGWARSNQTLITVVVVVAVVLVAGWIYYGNYRESLTQQAGNELEQIHQTLALQDMASAKDQLATFLQRFGNTPYADEARLLLGQIYLETGSPDQAVVVLEPLGSRPRSPLELQAAALLATAYEQEDRWEDAVDLYLRIADRADLDFQVRDALAAAARLRANHGDPAGAAQLYERLLASMDQEDPLRGIFEMRLAEVRERAQKAA
ncbi:MAG: tetratricopeptide repeat protein [Gemmatimonadota bacterium]